MCNTFPIRIFQSCQSTHACIEAHNLATLKLSNDTAVLLARAVCNEVSQQQVYSTDAPPGRCVCTGCKKDPLIEEVCRELAEGASLQLPCSVPLTWPSSESEACACSKSLNSSSSTPSSCSSPLVATASCSQHESEPYCWSEPWHVVTTSHKFQSEHSRTAPTVGHRHGSVVEVVMLGCQGKLFLRSTGNSGQLKWPDVSVITFEQQN